MRLALVALASVSLAACQSQPDYRDVKADPATVASVDLDNYAGQWYEIARYPNSFEKNCTNVTAEYTKRDDGKITVTNTCFKGSAEGKKNVAEGIARVVDGSNNSKLRVKFTPEWLPVGEGDYWILHLEQDYSAALVGDPEGKYLWILARETKLPEETLSRIKARASELGYRTEPLVITQQD